MPRWLPSEDTRTQRPAPGPSAKPVMIVAVPSLEPSSRQYRVQRRWVWASRLASCSAR